MLNRSRMTLSPQRLDKAAEAVTTYAIHYCHMTLNDMSTTGKQWSIYRLADATQHGPNELLERFDNKADAYKRLAELNARAAISAYLGDTHVDVPKEPTQSMRLAGIAEWARPDPPSEHSSTLVFDAIYRAMISAELTERDKG